MSASILLNNVDVDITSDEFSFSGGSKVLVVRADDFGGGNVTLESKSRNDTLNRFAAIEVFTANGNKKILSTVPGIVYRAVLDGSSGASNVYVELI